MLGCMGWLLLLGVSSWLLVILLWLVSLLGLLCLGGRVGGFVIRLLCRWLGLWGVSG